MGVDSGLSTFRGYTASDYRHSATGKSMDYKDICQGSYFDDATDNADRQEALKFWSKCRNQYQAAKPHNGYEILMKWTANRMWICTGKDQVFQTTNCMKFMEA